MIVAPTSQALHSAAADRKNLMRKESTRNDVFKHWAAPRRYLRPLESSEMVPPTQSSTDVLQVQTGRHHAGTDLIRDSGSKCDFSSEPLHLLSSRAMIHIIFPGAYERRQNSSSVTQASWYAIKGLKHAIKRAERLCS